MLDTKVNSLDVQLGEFPYTWQASIQQVINMIQVKERDNFNDGYTMIYSRSSFLLRESTSTLERCGNTESTNATEADLVLR
jgi:hypothetical protein